MSALVIESFPEGLHARLRQMAAAHRRSVPQETIRLIEKAMEAEASAEPRVGDRSKWAHRRVLPEYQSMIHAGAFAGGTDSSIALSEERDTR